MLQHARLPDTIDALVHVMEQINELLMSPEEAMLKAAETGDLTWLADLLRKFDLNPLDAVVKAASKGRLDAVHFLLATKRNRETHGNGEVGAEEEEEGTETDAPTRRVWKEAVVSAAKTGHLIVVQYLLPKIVASGMEDHAMDEAVWRVLDEAAANGHLNIVRFSVEHATVWGYVHLYSACSGFDALYRAISGGHDGVAKFLLVLEQQQIHWDLNAAFKLACAEGQQDIAEWIYAVYPQLNEEKDLLLEMIYEGHTSAVEHLVRVFPQSINHIFRYGDIAAVEFLYENGFVSVEKITTAFQDAARCGVVDRSYYFPSDEQVRMVNVLSKIKSISPRVIRMAFLSAAKNQHSGIVKGLCDDPRVPSQIVANVFLRAVNGGDIDMAIASYSEERISLHVVSKALKTAGDKGHVAIVRILICNPLISRAAKQEAFVSAARHNENEVARLMCNVEEWPVDIITKALKVTKDRMLKTFLLSKLREA